MEQSIFESKNFIITYLGEFEYKESEECSIDYMVHVKNIDCLDIKFIFYSDNDIDSLPWNQNNKNDEGEKITDFTFKIKDLVENDVIDIIKFMRKHLS
jgi:hypothetical protein